MLSPVTFFTFATLFVGLGFLAGKFAYGTVANISKARLEAARDDLARLERRKSEEIQETIFLRAEVAGLRGDIERLPSISVSDAPPPANSGMDGDIHLQVRSTGRDSLLPQASLFLSPPFYDLRSAQESATELNQPLFIVIYDEHHPTRSKLSYSLGYFLEYNTTRRLVDEYFLAVLVPSSDELARALVPHDDPLENCRWVVASDDGQILRSEGLYANPDEGLKRTREAIATWESLKKG